MSGPLSFPCSARACRPGAFAPTQVAALKALTLGFTAIEIDLSDEDGLATAREKIAAAPGSLRIDVRMSDEKKTLAAVAALAPLLADKANIGLSLWDAGDSTIAAARAVAPNIRIGGGTGAFFTELNRLSRWPAADYLAWTSNPTVHGSSDDTIGETIESLRNSTAHARSSARFQIGPMTLGLRNNPNATTPEGRRMASPPDPRQSELIVAAWVVGHGCRFSGSVVETLAFLNRSDRKGWCRTTGHFPRRPCPACGSHPMPGARPPSYAGPASPALSAC